MKNPLLTWLQSIVKSLSNAGYKTQVQPLSHFYDDYGLKGDDEDEDEADEDEEGEEDDDDMSGSDGDYSSEDEKMDG